MLSELPVDLLVTILSNLDPAEERVALIGALPLVCRSWSLTFGSQHSAFWILLAKRRLRSTRPFLGRRSPRNNAKRTFFRRQREIKDARRNEADRIVQELGKRLKVIDCVAMVRQRLQRFHDGGDNNNHSVGIIDTDIDIVRHPVASLEHRTLLHLACWWGRPKTVQLLLEQLELLDSESTTGSCNYNCCSCAAVDDSNATPLLIAAWAGHGRVVRLLVEHAQRFHKRQPGDEDDFRAYLDTKGVPPLTSSCGGRGAKSALIWAERKGFSQVVRLLEQAGASTHHQKEQQQPA